MKRFFTFLVLVVIVFQCVSCNNTDVPDNGKQTTGTTAETTNPTTTAATTAAATAAATTAATTTAAATTATVANTNIQISTTNQTPTQPVIPTSQKGPFPAFAYIYNTSDSHKVIGEYMQATLENAGITMELENLEWDNFLETRQDGDYTLARNGWLADYNDPLTFLEMWTSTSGNNVSQLGKGNHANIRMYNLDLTKFGYTVKVENGTWAQTYDVLIAAIKDCDNVQSRYEMMHLAEDMVMDTGCIVPLYYYTDLYMIDDSVKGFYSNPLGYKYFMNTVVEGKNTLDVCLGQEPASLDPALNSAVDGATIISHLFSGLAKWSTDAQGKLVIVPDLAVSLPKGVVNKDGTVTYTYTLKDNLKWSNGDALTAEDFVYSWNRAASAELYADYGYMFEVIKGFPGVYDGVHGAKLAVEAIDAKTLKVTLVEDVSYWNELLAFPTYYPVHRATVMNKAWATDPTTYVCNGPYKISAWAHNSVITLTQNNRYHNAASVTMPTIKCHLSNDANNMLTKFKNGTWLFIDDVPYYEISTLKKSYPSEFVVQGQMGTYYVCWNVNARILPANSTLTGVEAERAQQEIRKAISLLFDRNFIVEKVRQIGEVPASSFVAMGITDADGTQFYQNANSKADSFDGYYDVSEEAHRANVATAKQILRKYYTGIN